MVVVIVVIRGTNYFFVLLCYLVDIIVLVVVSLSQLLLGLNTGVIFAMSMYQSPYKGLTFITVGIGRPKYIGSFDWYIPLRS